MSARLPRTRVVLTVLGMLLLAGLAIVATRPRPVEVDLATVARGDLRVYVEEDGRARVRDRYVVATPTAGTLARLEHHPGDTVEAGAVLARIRPLTPARLDARARAEAQARAAVERAAMAAEQAKQERPRREALARAGATASAELEYVQFEERSRAEDPRSARFVAEVAAYQLRMARAAVGQMAGGRTDELEVTAPVAGRVLRLLQENEGAVAPGTPLLERGDPGALEVVVDVLTQDASRIRPGARVLLTRWGGADLDGRVRLVEPSAFTRLSSLGVEEQRVNCVIDLASPREAWTELGDGWRVEARILVAEARDVVIVPQSAGWRTG